MKEATTINPEREETPVTQDVVSDVIEEHKEGGKVSDVIENTGKNLLNIHSGSSHDIPTSKKIRKEKEIETLKEQLKKDMAPTVEQILEGKPTTKIETKPIEEKQKKEEGHYKEKSESKLWNGTKKILNRPLKHTWLGKQLKKLFKK